MLKYCRSNSISVPYERYITKYFFTYGYVQNSSTACNLNTKILFLGAHLLLDFHVYAKVMELNCFYSRIRSIPQGLDAVSLNLCL